MLSSDYKKEICISMQLYKSQNNPKERIEEEEKIPSSLSQLFSYLYFTCLELASFIF